MNVFERGLATLSPGWALSRARTRAALQVMLAYEANQVGRRSANWKASSGSANSEITPSLSRVRNRARDMVRNNPYARSAITKLVARAIGTGIVARPPQNVLPVWKEFVEVADFEGQHDLYGLESLIGRTVFESGECLVMRRRGVRLAAPLQISVLEPDYLDDLKFGAQANGNFVISGIEVTPDGRRAAYWIFDHHPGEVVQMSKTLHSKRVAASEILHVYEKERPGQLRGMPRLAASMMRLRDVDEYQDAVMMRKKIEACYAAFVKVGAGSGPLVGPQQVTTDEKGRREETLSPGMIMYGQPGEEISFGTPGAVSRDEYTVDQLHAIAAGVGVTYEQLTGDFSEVTYLSARAAQLELRELVEMFRWIHFIPMCCRGIWGWFQDAYYTAGRLRTPSYQVDWTAPAFPWIDPSKDVTAAKEEVKGGLTSLSAKIRERGDDPETVFKEISEEREKLKVLGVKLDTTSGGGPAVVVAEPEEPDPEPGKPGADDDDDEEETATPAAPKGGKTENILARAVLELTKAAKPAAAPVVHNHNTVNVPERGVTVNNQQGDTNVNVPERSVDVLVDVNAKPGATRTIVEKRDENGELVQTRTEPIEGADK